MVRTLSSAAGLSVALLLAGCGTVPVDRRFDRVENAVADRVPGAPVWPTDAAAREEIRGRIDALLTAPLTEENAVAIALMNNRDLRAAYAGVGVADAEFVEAGLLENPSFSAGLGFPATPPSGTEIDLGLTMPLLQAILRPARREIAAARLDAEVLAVSHAVIDTAMHTRLAYLDVQAAENLAAVLGEISESAAVSYEFALRLHEAGNLSDLDLANRRSLYETTRIEHARALADVAAKREPLNVLMGLWGPSTEWSIPAVLPEIPATESDLSGLESAAVRQRLDLAAEGKRYEAIAKAAGLQRDWRYLVAADVGADASLDAEGQWVVGPSVSVEIPLFDQHQGRIQRMDAELFAAEARFEGLAIRVRSEVRRLRGEMVAARYEAEHWRDTVVPLRERINALTLERYNFMLSDTFDLLAAKRESIEAYRAYIEGVHRYWALRAELTAAVGGRLPGGGGAGMEDGMEDAAQKPGDMDVRSDAHDGAHSEHGTADDQTAPAAPTGAAGHQHGGH